MRDGKCGEGARPVPSDSSCRRDLRNSYFSRIVIRSEVNADLFEGGRIRIIVMHAHHDVARQLGNGTRAYVCREGEGCSRPRIVHQHRGITKEFANQIKGDLHSICREEYVGEVSTGGERREVVGALLVQAHVTEVGLAVAFKTDPSGFISDRSRRCYDRS